ncbi:MAG: tetratricopeptide repeat protein, partial [Bacteroidota bacterium]
FFAIMTLSFFLGNAQRRITNRSLRTNTDSTFFKLREELESAQQKMVPIHIALGHLNLGEFYSTSGVYSEAVDQFNYALEILDSKKRDTLSVILSNNMGKVYLASNSYTLAQQYFEEGLETSDRLGYEKGRALSKGLLGSSYEKQGEYLLALGHQKESLSLFEKLGDKAGMSKTHENIGSVYEDLGQYNLAYEYFLKAYNYLEGKGTDEEANVLNNLGDIHRKKGSYGEALTFTKKALSVAEGVQDNHQLESAHKDLSKAYALMGDYQRAHQHLTQAQEFENALLLARNTSQLNLLQTIYESNKKEAQINLLKEQNKVSKANQNVLWVAIFALAAILIVLYVYLGRKRKGKLKLQEYRQRTLKAELDKKAVEEKNLQQEIKLKTSALSRYSLHLAQKNKILFDLSGTLKNMASRKHMDLSEKVRDLAKEIDFNLQQEHEWDEFMSFFKEIHPDFIKKLSELSDNSLSPAEMRLGMLLRLNMTSKEIASVLRVTPDSVRVARYRLRKKLPIDQKEELVNFMVEL